MNENNGSYINNNENSEENSSFFIFLKFILLLSRIMKLKDVLLPSNLDQKEKTNEIGCF